MNPSEVLVDPIETKYNNDSDSVSTDSTVSLLPGSFHIECSKGLRESHVRWILLYFTLSKKRVKFSVVESPMKWIGWHSYSFASRIAQNLHTGGGGVCQRLQTNDIQLLTIQKIPESECRVGCMKGQNRTGQSV